MPSVVASRRNDWFSPVSCEICHKALGNVPALITHLRSHMIDMRTNPRIATNLGRPRTSPSNLPTNNSHQSLLSPSSFSIFQTSNANPRPSHLHHQAGLSPNLAIHKPNTGFTGPVKGYENMFAVMETPSNLYNIVPNGHVLSDGVTKPFIGLLDRPIPVVIELDSDGEDDGAQDKERMDLSLKL